MYVYILIIVYKKAIKNPLERLSGSAVRGPPASVSELLCPAAVRVCVCVFLYNIIFGLRLKREPTTADGVTDRFGCYGFYLIVLR